MTCCYHRSTDKSQTAIKHLSQSQGIGGTLGYIDTHIHANGFADGKVGIGLASGEVMLHRNTAVEGQITAVAFIIIIQRHIVVIVVGGTAAATAARRQRVIIGAAIIHHSCTNSGTVGHYCIITVG